MYHHKVHKMYKLFVIIFLVLSTNCYAKDELTKNVIVNSNDIINVIVENSVIKKTDEPVCTLNVKYKSSSLSNYVGDYCSTNDIDLINNHLLKVTTVNLQGNRMTDSFYYYDENLIIRIGYLVFSYGKIYNQL